ncbi:MAG: sigma-54 dependent transcriptional regulator [Holosporaceae bacterium]|jgi:two-component system nitrogen regulation response regulator NtrX|nr:sigma-54 dependent transcriptional regulator [Holosporaceae bacterium]
MGAETILIVDDDTEVRTLMSDVLSDYGYKTNTAKNEHEAIAMIKKSPPDLILLDLWIGDDESAGLQILKKIKKINMETPVIMISGHGTIDMAVQAIQKGAFDFIEKPFVMDRLLLTCRQALDMFRLMREVSILRSNKLDTGFLSIGKSAFVLSIKSMLNKIASSNSRVFIKSKVGIGVDAIVMEIHRLSSRKDFPLISVNCFCDEKKNFGAELFGTDKTYGFIEKAQTGTLFLENVTQLSKAYQVNLLQFLQENAYQVGSRKVRSDVRIICSSNDDVDLLLASSKFNQELFYRLNIVCLDIPSLKDRREDILPLIDYYLLNAETMFGIKAKTFTENALAILQSYDWPGNIHQLKNVVESSLINSTKSNEVDKIALPPELTSNAREKFTSLNVAKLISLPMKEAKECFESDYLRAQINRFSGNVSKTAEFIGMERSALHRKLKTLGVESNKKVGFKTKLERRFS